MKADQTILSFPDLIPLFPVLSLKDDVNDGQYPCSIKNRKADKPYHMVISSCLPHCHIFPYKFPYR